MLVYGDDTSGSGTEEHCQLLRPDVLFNLLDLFAVAGCDSGVWVEENVTTMGDFAEVPVSCAKKRLFVRDNLIAVDAEQRAKTQKSPSFHGSRSVAIVSTAKSRRARSDCRYANNEPFQ
jgi:hypothetical protein